MWRFYIERHNREIVLKARQYGFTTLLAMMNLDDALFLPNLWVDFIADSRPNAEDIFKRKVRYAWDNWCDPGPGHPQREAFMDIGNTLREQGLASTGNRADMLEWANGSNFRVATSSRGGTVQRLHVCLAGDTGIYTRDAKIVRIDEVELGTKVLTSKGSYRTVVDVVRNRLEDVSDDLRTIDVFGYYEPLKLTAEHEVMTREHTTGKPVWKSAGQLVQGDYLAIPIREPSNNLRDGMLPFGDVRAEPTFDLGWVAGLYLAEGHIRRRAENPPTDVVFAIDCDELERTAAALQKIELGCDPRAGAQRFNVYRHDGSRTISLTVNSRDLAGWLALHFNASDAKQIPDKIWKWGAPFMKGLVKGYFDGDGSYKDIALIQATSTRRQLLDQMRLLLISLRYGAPTLYHTPAGRHHGRYCKASWTLKMGGAGNWKFREEYGMECRYPASRQAQREIEAGRRPSGRKFWRRGRDHYWMQVKANNPAPPVEFVYDLVLDEDPHDYVTVNGVVHNSEYGKIAAHNPERAREIRTGAFNAVPSNGLIVVESTAEGHEGQFYDMVAQARSRVGREKLAPIEFHLFFHAWWQDTDYVQDPDLVPIPTRMANYFKELETQHGIELTQHQKAWYTLMEADQGQDMWREYPSYEEEAFKSSIEGAYLSSELRQARLEQRIGNVMTLDNSPVHTAWDIGVDDYTAIWFFQRQGLWYRFIDFYQNENEGADHYVRQIQKRREDFGWIIGTHLLPHDARVREWGNAAKNRMQQLSELGLRDMKRVPPPRDKVGVGVAAMRGAMNSCWFDEAGCSEGISCLDNFRKGWDEKLGRWKEKPLKNWAIHGADAFQTFALGKHLLDASKSSIQIPQTVSATAWT